MSRFRHYLITNEIGEVEVDKNLEETKIAEVVNAIMDVEKDLSYVIAVLSTEKWKNYLQNFRISCFHVSDLLLKSIGVRKK